MKAFPKFDRALFSNPEKLFEGWVYDDFIALVDSLSPHSLGIDKSAFSEFDGWISGQKWELGVQSISGFMFVVPSIDNLFLFPYRIEAYMNGDIFFVEVRDSYGARKLTDAAVMNSGMTLSNALLVEAFCAEPCPPEMKKYVVENSLDDLPFDVLKEALLLFSKDSNEDFSIARYNVLKLAMLTRFL